ncbi:acyltransferase [Actinomycetes bacterium KLBMP 9797]
MIETTATTEPRPASPARLPSLTGVRGIAALVVFAIHAYGTVWAVGMSLETQGRGTRAAVPLVAFFFVLSGFVLVWSQRPTDTTAGFWRRRALKILPNHVVAWALCVAFLVGASGTLVTTLPTLFLVQNWLPNIEMNHGTNAVAWSLSVEMFCYLLFPVLSPLLRRIPAERLWAVIIATTALIFAVPTVAMFVSGGDPVPTLGITEVQYWLAFVFPPVRLLEFVLGMLLALALRSGRRVPLGIGASALLLLTSLAAGQFVPAVYAFAAVCALPLGLFVLALAAADWQGRFSPVRNRTAVWLGDISYAIYLTHLTVLLLVVRAFPTEQPRGLLAGLGLVALALGVCLTLSQMLYVGVEQPMMRRFAVPTRKSRREQSTVVGGALPQPAVATEEGR